MAASKGKSRTFQLKVGGGKKFPEIGASRAGDAEQGLQFAGKLADEFGDFARLLGQMIVQAAVKASGFRHRVKKIGGSGDTHGFRPDPPTPFLTEKRSARSHWAEPT
jgi:hypothetical protein